MKISTRFPFIVLFAIFSLSSLFSAAQTSWTGANNTSWSNTLNWTNGVPTSADAVTIGDASFTGSNQPTISANASCASLTLGATKTPVLTLSKPLTVYGNVTIGTGSTISVGNTKLYVKGNWTNNGTFSYSNNNATVIFSGSGAQSIGGTTATAFRKLTINTGSIVTMASNFSVANAFVMNGTLNPSESPTYIVSGGGTMTVGNGALLKVTASTYAGNYTISTTIGTGSTVEYSASTIDQTINSALTYATLKISGTGTRSLSGNTSMNTYGATATEGNVYVTSGTLDLKTFTLNRSASAPATGGTFSVSNGATLKVGGASNFPVYYSAVSLSLTSTTEYYGNLAQAISQQTYGNLTLSISNTTSYIKTLPATFTVAGNFVTSATSTGTLTAQASGDFAITGNVTLGALTIYNGGSANLTTNGNITNAGTITGNTGTITMNGSGTVISGGGVFNFNNLAFTASGITSSGTITLNVSGNLSTSSAGVFTQGTGGTLSMSGTNKTISGTGITLENFSVATGATITTTASFVIKGTVTTVGTGSFIASSPGNITLTNSVSKAITNAGTLTFSSLTVSAGSVVTTASSFNITALLSISSTGSFTASANTIIFGGNSTFNGTASLFNVTVSSTFTLQLAANASLGIAGTLTLTGTLDVTTYVPNTVIYNGAGATQAVTTATYNNLTVSNGNSKTTSGTVNINGDLTINNSPTTTLNTAANSVNIGGNLINNGTFTTSGTVTFNGTANASVTGATTFSALVINKSASTNVVTLASNVSAGTVTTSTGNISTGTNTLTITSTRTNTGTGLITGIITHSHAFTAATPYYFEGPNNILTFSNAGVTSVTEKITIGSVTGFPFGGSINRTYEITNISGTFTGTANYRLHYEDAELNGNAESTMQLWNYNGSSWTAASKTSNDVSNNYVELTGISSASATIFLQNKWTLSDVNNVVSWNGSSNTDWNNTANWTTVQGTPSKPPSANDIVQIGDANFTGSFQPEIITAAIAKGIIFSSTKASTLTLNTGGSLSVSGNISGTWSGNQTHNIITNGQNVTVSGDIVLSDGTSSHVINLSIGTGTVTVAGSVTQTGGANIIFSGAGNMNVGNNFNYTSGTFTAGTGTFTYNGSAAQTVAALTYNNLTVNKSAGIAAINGTTIGGNLTATSGELDINATTTVTGDVLIGASGKIVKTNSASFTIGGNWTNNGVFTVATGSVIFNGSGTQTLTGATTFNDLIVTKTAGSNLLLAANVTINSNFTVNSGNVNLSTFTANRASSGGTFTLTNGATLYVSGASNFPANFATYSLGTTSTVEYNSNVTAQTVSGVTYGNLTITNAATRNLGANTTVNGDLTINSGATLAGSSYTLNLYGNWVNSGTFSQTSGIVILFGTSKTITGSTTFNRITDYGSYTVSSGTNLTFNGEIRIVSGGTLDLGTSTATVNGDLTNSGTLKSDGTTTFTGAVQQTIRLLSAVVSSSTGIINFNGSVAPVLNSTTSPQFYTVNINNTGGVSPSVGWTAVLAFTVGSGASFIGGSSTHNIYGSFTNNGTFTSSGTINMSPLLAPQTAVLGGTFTSTGTVNFGGSYALSVSGNGSFKDVVIASVPGVTVTTGTWAVSKSFVINSGATFNAGAGTYNVAGDIYSSGTLNGGNSTFSVSLSGAAIYGNTTTTFYNLQITSAVTTAVTISSDINVSKNFTNAGLVDATVGTVIFTGTEDATIGGSATYDFSRFTVNKSSSATVTLNSALTTANSVTVTSGIFDLGSSTITQESGGGVSNDFNVSAGAFLKIGGTNGIPTFTTYVLDSLSTVEFYGASQAISATPTYGNLTLSTATSGTKTPSAGLTIKNNFTLSTATFAGSSFTYNVGGNWTMTSGSLTWGTQGQNNGTVNFNGTAVQNVSSTGAFFYVTANKTASYVNLLSDITATGTLTFTLGKIYTNANTLYVTGTVSGAAQGTGWVYGNLKKDIATGSNVTKTYEVGGPSYYSPVTVLLASVTTGGTITALATNSEHPQISFSGIDDTKSVNRYWTLTNSGVVFTTDVTNSVTLNFVSSDIDAAATGNTASFITGIYDGSAWTLPTTASPLTTSIQAKGFSALGDFAVGQAAVLSTWTGAAGTSNWFTATNWSGGVPSSTKATLIPSSLVPGRLYPVINTSTATTTNLTIQNNGSLTVNSTLQISGSISNSGTFTATSGTIEFNGSSAQVIPASTFAGNVINGLKISNAAGVSLGGTLGITDVFSFGNVNSSTFTTGGYLVIKSNASNTGRIADITNAGANTGNNISGNVTVERYITAASNRAYRLLTPSVNTSTTIRANWQENVNTTVIGQINDPNPGYGTNITGTGGSANGFDVTQTNNASLFIYNQVTPAWTALTNTNLNTLNAKTGYLIFIRGNRNTDLSAQTNPLPSSNTTLRATGTLLTGNQVYSGLAGGTSFSLITNPYASPVNWANIYAGNTGITQFYTFWDPNYGTRGGYVTVGSNGVPSYGNASLNIQSGQAFFIQANNTTPTVTIREANKSTVNNIEVFRATAVDDKISVGLFFTESNGNLRVADGITAVFNDAYSTYLDDYDAKEIANFDENIAFLTQSNTLSIESRPTVASRDTLSLFMNHMKVMNYKLAIAGEFNNTAVQGYLKDNYLQTLKPISLAGDTTFIDFSVTADAASSATNRFSIIFDNPAGPLPVTLVSLRAYQQSNDIALEWKAENVSTIQEFRVERSFNGRDFTQIASIKATDEILYNLTDAGSKDGANFYRIKTILKSGKEVYSAVVNIRKGSIKQGINVYPNPVTDGVIHLQLNNIAAGNYKVTILSAIGEVMSNTTLKHAAGNSTENVTVSNFAKGVYQLRMSGDEAAYTIKVVVQ